MPRLRLATFFDERVELGRDVGEIMDGLLVVDVVERLAILRSRVSTASGEPVVVDGISERRWVAQRDFGIQLVTLTMPELELRLRVGTELHGPLGGPWMQAVSPRAPAGDPLRVHAGQDFSITARNRSRDFVNPAILYMRFVLWTK